MTVHHGLSPQAPLVPLVPLEPLPGSRPDRGRHRDSNTSGGHPLVPPVLQSNPGARIRTRNRLLPYLATVLLPLVGALLILGAVRLYGQPPAAEVVPPTLQVAVSPSACTFPDGS